MLKKLINYAAILSLVAVILAPSMSLAAGSVSITSSLKDMTTGGNTATEANVGVGDNILVTSKVSNGTGASTGSLVFYAKIPAGLNYVSGSAKLNYTDANGQDQVAPLGDYIVGTNGVTIGEVPAAHYELVSYLVKAGSNGSFSIGNQIYNGGSINFASSAKVNVSGTAANSNTTTTNANTTIQGQDPAVVAAQGSIYVQSLVSNDTKGQVDYFESTTASRGDTLYYRVEVANGTSTGVTGLVAYLRIPYGLQYVPGYTKLYYTDASGKDQVAPITDAVVNATGAVIGDLPAKHYEYLVYRVKVADNAPSGTYATGNQVFNASGINVSDNTGNIKVDVVDVNTPKETKGLSLKATGYDVTLNQNVSYSNSVNAKRGDEIKFRIDLANLGNTKLTNAKIANSLPNGLEYVANSVKVVINGNSVNIPDSKVISLGDLNVGANGYIEFSAKIKADLAANVANLVYSASGNADGISQVSSIVTINLGAKATTGNETLPSTGVATTVLALILLALFTSVASYVYLKESNGLKKAVSLIKR